jgi:hypothetical protein
MRLVIGLVGVSLSALVCAVAPAQGDEPSSKIPKSFQECVEQGGQVQESFPAICISKEGIRFVQPSSGRLKACTDKCGDGQCQEIVCMAVGCPCSESHESCPKDCHE